MVVPMAMVDVVGVMSMELSVACVTDTGEVPETPVKVAVIVAWPLAIPAKRPAEVTVALLVADELHDAVLVTSLVELSENVAVAVN